MWFGVVVIVSSGTSLIRSQNIWDTLFLRYLWTHDSKIPVQFLSLPAVFSVGPDYPLFLF